MSTGLRARRLGIFLFAAVMAGLWCGAGPSRAQPPSSLDHLLSYGRMGKAIGTTPGAMPAAKRTPPPVSTTTFVAGPRNFLEYLPEAQRARARQVMPICDRIYAEAMNMAALAAPADRQDLASSSAFYLEMSRSLYWRGQPDAPSEATPAQLRGLRDRLKQNYLEQGTFADKGDAEKQLAHDALLFMACAPTLQYFDAARKKDEAGKQAARTAAAALLARFNLYPTSFRYRADNGVEITPGPAQW